MEASLHFNKTPKISKLLVIFRHGNVQRVNVLDLWKITQFFAVLLLRNFCIYPRYDRSCRIFDDYLPSNLLVFVRSIHAIILLAQIVQETNLSNF
jgi:hypothetical protein